jgi:hypothetical protein
LNFVFISLLPLFQSLTLQDRKNEKRKAEDLSGESVNDYIVGPSSKKKKRD